jgi:hypothetical protein
VKHKHQIRARLKAKVLIWKTNCLNKTKDKRALKACLKRSVEHVARLEAEMVRLKAITEPQRVANHVYPAQMIAIAVYMVIHGGASLRCTSKTIAFLSQMMGWHYGQPSHVTVRRWVLRCGLYGLKYTKDKAGRYIGIIDESIQIGREKMLLFLGVKLSEQHSHCAPLTMSDVEVLGVEVQQSWTGDEVAQFIEDRLLHHQHIELEYVISDRGTNLLAALRKLGIDMVSDCTHMMMNAVKKLFCENQKLNKLSSKIGQLRRKLMQTHQGYLLPPTLRDKDRFLRIFTIVDWARRIDTYWDKLPKHSRKALAFLKQAKPLVQCLTQIRALIKISAQVLKSAGLSPVSHGKWEERICQYTTQNTLTPEAEKFIQSVRAYFVQHDDQISKNGRLLCCSDIIESTFGRYKNKGSTKVISADVLGIALYNQNITTNFIQKAMTTVHQKQVHAWEQLYTCDNRYSILRRMDRELKSVT